MLRNMLDHYPEIFWDGETSDKMFHRISDKSNLGIDHLYGEFCLEDAVDKIASRMAQLSGGRFFGTEIQDYHLQMLSADSSSFLHAMRALGFDRFLILKRNPIRKLVSHIVATERSQHHATVGQTVRRSKVTIYLDRKYIGHRFTTIEQTFDSPGAIQYAKFFGKFEASLGTAETLHLTYGADVENDP